MKFKIDIRNPKQIKTKENKAKKNKEKRREILGHLYSHSCYNRRSPKGPPENTVPFSSPPYLSGFLTDDSSCLSGTKTLCNKRSGFDAFLGFQQ